jgi:hypothetical protein
MGLKKLIVQPILIPFGFDFGGAVVFGNFGRHAASVWGCKTSKKGGRKGRLFQTGPSKQGSEEGPAVSFGLFSKPGLRLYSTCLLGTDEKKAPPVSGWCPK